MKTKKIWANLGVKDLERTSNFYSNLGFKPNGTSKKLTSFLFGENELVIHFFLKDHLTSGMKGEIADLKVGNEVLLTLSADCKAEIDQWEKEIEKAGGTLISKAEDLGRITMVLFLPTQMVIGSMYSICGLWTSRG